MVKPNEKLKKIIKLMGITGAVYLIFRYLLPLIIPFFVAGVLAAILYPSARILSQRIRFSIGKKQIGLPVCLAGIFELLLAMAALGIWLWAGGQRLYKEGTLLLTQFPVWLEKLDIWLTGTCYRFEDAFDLHPGSLVFIARDMLRALGIKVKDGVMPYLMSNSMGIFGGFVGAVIMAIIMILAIAMFLQEMPDIKKWCQTSVFHDEIAMIRDRLVLVGKVYIKTQGMILLIVTGICIAGLFLMGNPYSILIGIGIGVMDALPVLGAGTAFIPWILFSLFTKQWQQFGWLLVIYLICYFLRQYLEARLIGKQVGLSPLTTLLSLFIGLRLFGLGGVILGPIGLMLIQDFCFRRNETGNT